jgi:hypothetical protein
MSTKASVRPVEDLQALARQINAAHDDCQQAFTAGMLHAVRTGQLLIEAKRQIARHGEWLPWLESNCCVPIRLAQKYMFVAREAAKLDEADTPRVAYLSFREALVEFGRGAAAVTKIPEADKAEAFQRTEESDGRKIRYAARDIRRLKQLEENQGPARGWWTLEDYLESEEEILGGALEEKKKLVSELPEFVEREQQIEAMKAEAERLFNESEKLRAHADDATLQLRQDIEDRAESELEQCTICPAHRAAMDRFDEYLAGRDLWDAFREGKLVRLLKEADAHCPYAIKAGV